MGIRAAIGVWGFTLLAALAPPGVSAQTAPAAAAPQTATAEPAKDPLGRSTPRGTVLGFLAAARKGDNALARYYLDTKLSQKNAEELAHQLFVVLDARLPARLAQVSDLPEGSGSDPLAPNHEHVGSVAGPAGPVEIAVERVRQPKGPPVWLFSAATVGAVPDLYADVAEERGSVLPRFLLELRLRGVRLFDWLLVILGIPAVYFATVLLNRLLTPVMAFVWRRLSRDKSASLRNALPMPARLLVLSIVGRWLLTRLPLSLLTRQLLATIAGIFAVAASAWLLILVSGQVERLLYKRIPSSNLSATVSLLRVGRRIVDIFIVLLAVLLMLRRSGIDITPVLAGLGVGGIAVALAAQKTLENVIAGASLIFDQAVRVGDFLKMGEVIGTVDHIGLRSTRIRTLDRTMVSVPNSQIANASLETLSARDQYWFHPIVSLRYETTPEELRAVLEGIRALLIEHPSVDRESIRVRLIRLGAFSLDAEVFAYFWASDWNQFLELQEALLLRITEIVRTSGASLAFPSQTVYVSAETTASLAAK